MILACPTLDNKCSSSLGIILSTKSTIRKIFSPLGSDNGCRNISDDLMGSAWSGFGEWIAAWSYHVRAWWPWPWAECKSSSSGVTKLASGKKFFKELVVNWSVKTLDGLTAQLLLLWPPSWSLCVGPAANGDWDKGKGEEPLASEDWRWEQCSHSWAIWRLRAAILTGNPYSMCVWSASCGIMASSEI